MATLALVAAAMMPQMAHAQVSNVLGKNGLGVAPTYAQQQTPYYCAPATAQMILSTANPAVAIPTQANLFNQMVAAQGGNYNGAPPPPPGSFYNNDGSVYTVSPAGLESALQADAPAYTWVAYNVPQGNANAGLNSANRTLAYDIAHYQVAACATVGGSPNWPNAGPLIGGAHAITVFGVTTSVQPTASGNFTVSAFYVKDPWPPTGFAMKSLTLNMGATGANALWTKYFIPANPNIGGPWANNYNFVADPDSPDTVDPVFPSAPGNLANELNGSQADTYAANDIAADAELSNDPAFEGGGFTTNGEMEDRADPDLAQDEWIVPYYDGSGDLTGIALVDADTGVLDGALWNEGGTLSSGELSFVDAAEENDSLFPADDVVPEPGSLVLLASGGLGLAALRRSRRGTAAMA